MITAPAVFAGACAARPTGSARSRAPRAGLASSNARLAGFQSLRVSASRAVSRSGRRPLVTFATAGEVVGGEVRPDYDTYFPTPAPQRRAGVLLHPTSLPVRALVPPIPQRQNVLVRSAPDRPVRFRWCLPPIHTFCKSLSPHGIGKYGWVVGLTRDSLCRAPLVSATSVPRRTRSWIGSTLPDFR